MDTGPTESIVVTAAAVVGYGAGAATYAAAVAFTPPSVRAALTLGLSLVGGYGAPLYGRVAALVPLPAARAYVKRLNEYPSRPAHRLAT